jgi:hypothetical protein
LIVLLLAAPAHADPVSGSGEGEAGNAVGGGPESVDAPVVAVFLCPGVGSAAVIFRTAGGGWCDFGFGRTGHTHCEWGGFAPVAAMWNCWRVFPGRPDHPQLPDPDIIPDGWMVPWALTGPSQGDQWPPPGMVPIPPPEGPPPP